MDPVNTTKDSRYLTLDIATAQRIDNANPKLNLSLPNKKPTLKERLLGDVDQRSEDFEEYIRNNTNVAMLKSTFEPGYTLRLMTYASLPADKTRKQLVQTGLAIEAGKIIIIYAPIVAYAARILGGIL